MRERTLHKDEARPPAPICYICGGLGRPDSRDHVIPDCFFKSPRPANLLTLPAHYTCHNRFDDEYARDILSGLGSEGSDIAQELWNTKTKRPFERSAPLRKSFRESLVRKIDLTSPAGLVFDQGPCPPNRKGPVLPINAQDRTRYVPLPHWRVLAAEFPFRMEPKRVRWNCRTTGGECWKHRSLA